MKQADFKNIKFLKGISTAALFLFSILLILLPFSTYAQMEAVENGVTWLQANQNPSGSWGDENLKALRDTTVVTRILNKLSETGSEYDNAIRFIESSPAANNDYLARKTATLAQNGSDVSEEIDALLNSRNSNEPDTATPNYPEGGWGAAGGYSTNNLDTALAIDALGYTPVPKGLLVIDKTITAGGTQDFYFDYPADISNFQIYVTEISGNIDFRIFPNESSAFYQFVGLTFSTYLNTTGIPIEPGTRRIQIYGNSETTYSFQITMTSGGYDSSVLIHPVAYLIESQNPDGGWGLSKDSESNVYMTSKVLLSLEEYADNFDLSAIIDNGISWLKTRQNVDNGFGEEASSVYETALSYTAIANIDASCSEAQNALAYLISIQDGNGSWNSDPYDTAVSLIALYTSLLTVDSDGDTVPDILDNCPDDANSDQTDTDGDRLGNICDDDDDNDGLTDDYEINSTGTNPLEEDSDGDGVLDGAEDMDFDGISNADEANNGTQPGTPDINLTVGLNLFGYPVSVPPGYTSYDLLYDLGTDAEVLKIQRYDSVSDTYETTTYESGVAGGDEFSIVKGEGYLVYMGTDKSVSFPGLIESQSVSLAEGLNIVSISCMPSGYTSYDLLTDIGTFDDVTGIQKFNRKTGAFETTGYLNEITSGIAFDIVNSEAYMIHMKSAGSIPVLLSAPAIAITSPADGDTILSSPIDVTGTINDNLAVVTVNGMNATISGGIFTASSVPLVSGQNTITATAMNTDNLTGMDTISVTLDEGLDYEINKGSSVNDARNFQGDSALLDQTAYYTEGQVNVPTGVTYSTTGVTRISATEFQISFSISVAALAAEGIHEFQVEYGLLDSGQNPLVPLTNNIFSFRIKVMP